MTKKRSGKGKRLSMFSALPPTLKYALRTQPRLETPTPQAATSQAQQAPKDRYLPTQPPSEAGEPEAASEGSSMDMDMDSESESDAVDKNGAASGSDQDDSDKENVRPASVAAPPPVESRSPSPGSDLGSAVVSRRVETAPLEANADHPWDCTGLVPRYTDASSLPKDLRKCELSGAAC